MKADFNRDQKVDLAVGVFNSNEQVAVFPGDGNGGFTQSASVAGTALYNSLAATDIDGNRTQDLVCYNEGKANLARGTGDGTFRAVHQINLPRSHGFYYSLSTGDLNGDGRSDIFAPQKAGVLLFNVP